MQAWRSPDGPLDRVVGGPKRSSEPDICQLGSKVAVQQDIPAAQLQQHRVVPLLTLQCWVAAQEGRLRATAEAGGRRLADRKRRAAPAATATATAASRGSQAHLDLMSKWVHFAEQWRWWMAVAMSRATFLPLQQVVRAAVGRARTSAWPAAAPKAPVAHPRCWTRLQAAQ